jgi:hypothetical protein
MRRARLVLVLAIVIAGGCFSKRGPRGSNTGVGSDNDGPWSQGGGESAALTEKP